MAESTRATSVPASSIDGRADGFVPPPYPYDRLDRLRPLGEHFDGGIVDLSIGTPCDPPPPAVVAALSSSDAERGYPPSIGTEALRRAMQAWMRRRFDVDVPVAQIGACVGTKELVATAAHLMRLRSPGRDTVLFPAIAYPTYEMSATLAGCRGVAVPDLPSGGMDFGAIDPSDARRSVLLWVNSPSNPTGSLTDLPAAAQWGRANDVPVFSDECYVEFTWDAPATSILQSGTEGVVAVHSLSKRSNLAGMRVGFYAGDADIVGYLREVRKHVGLLVPGPAQAAAVVAFDDDAHVAVQRDRYRRRLDRTADVLGRWAGLTIEPPAGGFYLWFDAADGWAFAERLVAAGGALVSPGDFYGAGGANNVRVAVVQPDDRIDAIRRRLGVS